jgi:hypothetical protein
MLCNAGTPSSEKGAEELLAEETPLPSLPSRYRQATFTTAQRSRA